MFHAPIGRFQLDLRQETEETSTLTKPVENVVLTTKGQQLLDGTMVEKR